MNESILFVTGISGAGRAEVMKVLEDLDFFCIDNMPLVFLQNLTQLTSLSTKYKQRLAIAVDVRGHDFFSNFLITIDNLQNEGASHNILFLDCDDDVLVRRYSETRRRHPIQKSDSIYECIAAERILLAEIRARASFILDTSLMKTHELRKRIGKMVLHRDVSLDIIVNIMSFGFKNGVPLDADFMFDVRFLDNPYYETDLRSKTGLDLAVSEYVFSQPKAHEAVENILNLMTNWIPLHAAAGKTYLTLAIGCTGGQHRSVAITQALETSLGKLFNSVTTVHRDI
ncbi:MAG: RNase adapter RapZ [Amylibacter sp.]|jgi:UPF0042 nucleotide-binding protein|tara:strand:- start:5384 stop:6238 length:855 start_codon:yes stop_codon:yes gene_type:complete